MYLEKAKKMYEEQIGPYKAEVHGWWSNVEVGCSKAEVEGLEKALGLKIPKAVVEFLEWMGHGSALWHGSEWGYNAMRPPETITERVRADMKQDAKETGVERYLPEDALVFYTRYGATFMFVRLGEGENPGVYYGNYAEEIEKISETFGEFMENSVEIYATNREQQRQDRLAPKRSNLCASRAQQELQIDLEKESEKPRIDAALQEIAKKLSRIGRADLMTIFEQSWYLVKKGKMWGLEVFIVSTAELPEEKIPEELAILERANKARTAELERQ